MRTMAQGMLAMGLVLGATTASADLLTADRAVQIALTKSSQAINADASVLNARGGVYSAYSGILPRIGAGLTRSGSWTNHSQGNQAFGGFVTPSRNTYDIEGYSTTPEIQGSWSVLNLSALTGWSAAGSAFKAAELGRHSTRNDVVLAVRRQFYDVVRAVQLARVNTEALKLSRDNERRVRALFEVGSVSKSDVLKAQVQTAQSELDSLSSVFAVTTQRINLAGAIGISEREMGEVDTVLTVEQHDYDEGALLREAEQARPDLRAAEADFRAAELNLRAARLARLPYLTVSGQVDFRGLRTSSFKQPRTIRIPNPASPGDSIDTGIEDPNIRLAQSTRSKSDRSIGASIALNWDLFDGLAMDSRTALARAGYMRSEESLKSMRRNLESEVHQALIGYREALEGARVAGRALESAEENLKLTQQKYNVGSSTILDLIDAQVQLQRARSQGVGAKASIRVAEAALEHVRGRGE